MSSSSLSNSSSRAALVAVVLLAVLLRAVLRFSRALLAIAAVAVGLLLLLPRRGRRWTREDMVAACCAGEAVIDEGSMTCRPPSEDAGEEVPVWYGGSGTESGPDRSDVDMDVRGGEMECIGEGSRSSLLLLMM
jgi:hypothetical protein